MEAVVKFGITSDDFTTLEAKNLWSMLLSYYSQHETEGSVLSENVLQKWFKNFVLPDDMPSYTIEALCHEVRRERITVGGNAAAVELTQSFAVPTTDAGSVLRKAATELASLAQLAASAAGNRRLTARELAEPLPPAQFVVEALGIEPGAPTLVVGYGYSGKSLALQSMALALAAPSAEAVWGTFARSRRCRVLHLDYEQGERLTCRRYQDLAKGLSIDLAGLDQFLATQSFPTERLSADYAGFYEECAREFDVVIIDAFAGARALDVDENSAEARASLDMLTAVSDRTGCVFIVVHHAPKGAKDDARHMARGSSALFDAASNMLLFRADAGSNELHVSQPKNRGGRACAPFTLSISETPNGGIVIAATTESTAESQHTKLLASQVLDFLSARGGHWTGSLKLLKGELGVSSRKHPQLVAAVAQLVGARRLTETPAKGQKTTYALAPSASSNLASAARPRPLTDGNSLAGTLRVPEEAVPDAPPSQFEAMTSTSERLSRRSIAGAEQPPEAVPAAPPFGGGTATGTSPHREPDVEVNDQNDGDNFDDLPYPNDNENTAAYDAVDASRVVNAFARRLERSLQSRHAAKRVLC